MEIINKLFSQGEYTDQESLNMLRQNCFAYFHGHSVGGTNPSLIEAMYMKNILLAHDNQFNQEVCEDSALYFKDSDDLKEKIDNIERNPENYLEFKSRAFKRVQEEYSWDKIVGQYDGVFRSNERVKKDRYNESKAKHHRAKAKSNFNVLLLNYFKFNNK